MDGVGQEGNGRGRRRGRRRHFWCALAQREVEVELERAGLAGFWDTVAVRSCTAFDPPSAVACARRCLDASFRRQWEPALPVLKRQLVP
ncbi:MAG: hypothetical protein HY727_05425 [Candidatus Rokubacteria bacterium]|nr:hypothetical protein [Candidatus Rokubacteria bacterium]